MAPPSNFPAYAGASAQKALKTASASEYSASPADSLPLRVCVVYAFPSLTSGHGPKLLQTVTKTLGESGVPFDLFDLYRSNFNPVTSESEHAAYGKSVGPDVAAIQSILKSAEVWIFLYPVWWSTPPAILKGWIDRALTPNFAFTYDSKGMHPLMEHKRALVIRTFGGSALIEQENGNVASGFMDKAVLGACGLKVVSQDIYSAETLAESAFNHALFQAAGATRRVLTRPTGVPHHLRSISAPYLPPIEPKVKLPVDEEGEEKIELSDEAKSDLEFFKSARRHAREAVHRKADARTSAGKNERTGQGSDRRNQSNSRPTSNFMRPASNRYGGEDLRQNQFGSRPRGGGKQKNWSSQNSSNPNSGRQNQNQGRPGQTSGLRPPAPSWARSKKPNWSGGKNRRR